MATYQFARQPVEKQTTSTYGAAANRVSHSERGIHASNPGTCGPHSHREPEGRPRLQLHGLARRHRKKVSQVGDGAKGREYVRGAWTLFALWSLRHYRYFRPKLRRCYCQKLARYMFHRP